MDACSPRSNKLALDQHEYLDTSAESPYGRLLGNVRDLFIRGGLAERPRIPEAELYRWLGVSSTPLREVQRSLSKKVLVTSRANRVSLVTPTDRFDLMQVIEAKGVPAILIAEQTTRQETDEDLSQVAVIHGGLVKV
ncbi:MAG: hypothetical protein AAF636_14860 [Pseudomonadota bacterium]